MRTATLVGIASAALALPLAGCRGHTGGSDGADPGVQPAAAQPPPADAVALIGRAGPRALTPFEYANALEYVLQEKIPMHEVALMPSGESVFGTSADDPASSAVPLVRAAASVAENALDRLRADPRRRDQIVGCVPRSATDEPCLTRFVAQFGRRVLRRPLRDDEVTYLVGRALAEGRKRPADAYRGIELVMRTLLQDVEFVYRVERGAPAGAGLAKLTSHEMASRLSFLLWGRPPQESPPDAAAVQLPRLADEGRLSTADEIVSAARVMLGAGWARTQIRRFHALWMQYEGADSGASAETQALVDRVLFDEASTHSWLDLFRMKETCVTERQAKAYGLPWPSAGVACGERAVWVPYPDSDKQGILSHASILGVSLQGHEHDENSVIFRGKYLQSTFLCTDVPSLPPERLRRVRAFFKADRAKTGDVVCKPEIARDTRLDEGTSCAGCHTLMDHVGFGLDNYDGAGRFHSEEDNGCAITGEGEVFVDEDTSLGTFKGPAGLADLLIDKQMLDQCAVKQLFRFSMGHREDSEPDRRLVESLTQSFRDSDHEFMQTLLALVGSPAFRYRRID